MDQSQATLENVERDNKNHKMPMESTQQHDQYITEGEHPRDANGHPINDPKMEKKPLHGYEPEDIKEKGLDKVHDGEKRAMDQEYRGDKPDDGVSVV